MVNLIPLLLFNFFSLLTLFIFPTVVFCEEGPWLDDKASRGALGWSGNSKELFVARELSPSPSYSVTSSPVISSFKTKLMRLSNQVLSKGEEIFITNLFKVFFQDYKGAHYASVKELEALLSIKGNLQPFVWDVLSYDPIRLLESHPWVKSARVEWKIFPLRLSIFVKEYDPWLVADYKNRSWLISKEGNLIVPLENIRNADLIIEIADLPRLGGLSLEESSFSSLKSPNTRFNYAVNLLKMLKATGELPFTVESYTLLPQGGLKVYPLEVNKYPVVLLRFTSFEEGKVLMKKVRAVLKDLSERGEKPGEVDFRFQNQAVVR